MEDSDFGAELIKEGFTLEFMKNALIKPVLSLKSKEKLLDWWKQVQDGKEDVPLPPESEVFKSENYSSFIFLYFKMATEVNVFAHLGKTLLTHMKNSLFSDVTEVDSDEEDETTENGEANQPLDNNTSEQNGENSQEQTSDVIESTENGKENSVEELKESSESLDQSLPEPEPPKPKTITSMYGKVYTLKK